MDVILLEKVTNLGNLGDKVTVKNGYGRNFLIPQGKAVFATKDNLVQFEARRAELEAKAAELLSAAQAKADKLAELNIKISSKAGEEGKLFGSIGARDLAKAITEAGVEVSHTDVRLPEGPLRHTGEFDIDLHLHTDIDSKVKIVVEAE